MNSKREWTAEVTVDEALARRLIDAQFPELGVRTMRPLAEGSDNAVWLVDETWVFRFPRREIALPGVERELAVLPHVAPLLPLAIPTPAFVGHPTEDYAWLFFGSALLPGTESGEAGLTDEVRIELASTLGSFLRTLHSPRLTAAVEAHHDLPRDPLGRADMSRRVPLTIEYLAEAQRLGLWRPRPSVDRLLETARDLPAASAGALVHGDLHFRHLLVDHGQLTGIIDWGDLCLSDPSVDFLLLWSFFPPEGRQVFLDTYGPVSDEQLVQARVLALSISAALAVYGRHESLRTVEREAVAGLERAAAE